MQTPFSADEIVQTCYVVPNLELACTEFNRAFGLGPFLGGDAELVLENHRYRGQPAPPIRLKGVFVQSGDMNIELVQVLSDGPCAFTDMYPERTSTGVHHQALFAENYEARKAAFIECGYPVVSEFEIEALGTAICYLDTRSLNGHMIELYEENPIIRGMYAQTREAAGTWDGEKLIQPWG